MHCAGYHDASNKSLNRSGGWAREQNGRVAGRRPVASVARAMTTTRLLIVPILSLVCVGCGDRQPAERVATPRPFDVTPDADLQSLLALPVDADFEFNMNVAERDRLLGLPDGADASGDITRFDEVDAATLEKLLRGRWADPRDRQNAAPSIAEVFRFMKRWPQVRACGYAVSSKRDDYRVSLEGVFVESGGVSRELRSEFLKLAEDADELTTDRGLSAWWD